MRQLTAPPEAPGVMARDLYEMCPVCEGIGAIRPTRSSELPPRLRKLRHRWIDCPACDGARFVRVGLTVGQVERLIADVNRLREAAGSGRVARHRTSVSLDGEK